MDTTEASPRSIGIDLRDHPGEALEEGFQRSGQTFLLTDRERTIIIISVLILARDLAESPPSTTQRQVTHTQATDPNPS
jgi:hypothetical protein